MYFKVETLALLVAIRILTIASKCIERRSKYSEFIKSIFLVVFTIGCYSFTNCSLDIFIWDTKSLLFCVGLAISIYLPEFISNLCSLYENITIKKLRPNYNLFKGNYYLYFKTVIVAPVCEEIIFRGVFTSLLSEVVPNIILAIIIVALSFSLAHWDSDDDDILLKLSYTFLFSLVSSIILFFTSTYR